MEKCSTRFSLRDILYVVSGRAAPCSGGGNVQSIERTPELTWKNVCRFAHKSMFHKCEISGRDFVLPLRSWLSPSVWLLNIFIFLCLELEFEMSYTLLVLLPFFFIFYFMSCKWNFDTSTFQSYGWLVLVFFFFFF